MWMNTAELGKKLFSVQEMPAGAPVGIRPRWCLLVWNHKEGVRHEKAVEEEAEKLRDVQAS